jgi:hypothetical protein
MMPSSANNAFDPSLWVTSANDVFDPTLWATFVSTVLGLEIPVLSSLPRLNNNPLAK